jgi:Hint module
MASDSVVLIVLLLSCQLSIINICDNDNVNVNETRVEIVALSRKKQWHFDKLQRPKSFPPSPPLLYISYFTYFKVVFIPHGANKQTAVFTHITTCSGRDIKMTQNHILPAGTCSLSPSPQTALLPLVYASQVSVGDCIMTVAGQEKVTAVEKVRGEGVYTIVTNQVIPTRLFRPYFLFLALLRFFTFS